MNLLSLSLAPSRSAGGLLCILRIVIAASLALATACLAMSPARAVTIDMVTVGNAGNVNDPATGDLYGAVNYDYRIGKYDVTIQQYTDFLNAVAATDTYSLYNTSMASDLTSAGISRSGTSGGYTYSVIGSSGNKPITYVSWFDAARFANWMQNGQGSGSTETGAYTLPSGQTSGTAPAKNPGATFYIPMENEWYKAAYYSPLLNSGSGGYYAYATQSDSAPGNTIGSGANQANYYTGAGYAVTQSSSYSSSQNYLTDVGAFTNSASFYGTFDQSGNVYQWNDLDGTAGSSRGLRGGNWDSDAFNLSASDSLTNVPSRENRIIGFRLASPIAPVPEPATYAMALAGLACGGFSMWRRRKRAGSHSPAVTALLGIVVMCIGMKPARAVTIDMVTVGNAGNVNDTTGYGAVGYSYRIGKYEVTIQQYTDFLNAVDPNGTNPFGLYNNSMGTDANIRGILYSAGSVSGQKYSPIGSAARPITYVSWFDAARFANWMQNGQGSGSTETGAYTLVDGQTSGEAPAKNPGAQFYIPTENEWYKAAYYSPVLNSGSGGYYAYATQSNTAPGNIIGSGTNQANYITGAGYSVTQLRGYSSSQNYLTDVGAFTNSASYYGTFDQSGGAWEWNDLTGDSDSSRGLRGGTWSDDIPFGLSSSGRDWISPLSDDGIIGFRLASPVAVPEPSTWVMGAVGIACAGWSAWRRRTRA